MRNVTLRQLAVFEAVARHLSFTRASEELHLTQPAVSMQIKQLEELVGSPLFEQLGKKNYLTEAGHELYHYAREIAALLDEARMVLDEMQGVKRGRLVIAVASTANYFAPKLLAAFSRRFPAVTYSLDVSNREALLRHLAENTKDLVIMGRPPAEVDLVAHPFMDNPLVVIAPPGHPLAGQPQVPLSALEKESFIVREPGSGTRIAMERFFAERGVALSTSMEMSSNEAIKQAVEAGLGLGLLSLHTLELELETQRLAVLNVEGLPIMRHWYVVHREGKRLSAVAQAFRDFMVEDAAALLSGSPGLAAHAG